MTADSARVIEYYRMADDPLLTDLLQQIAKAQERAVEILNDLSANLVDLYNLEVERDDRRERWKWEYQVFSVPAAEVEVFSRQMPKLGEEHWELTVVVPGTEAEVGARPPYLFYFKRVVPLAPEEKEETVPAEEETPLTAARGKAIPAAGESRKQFLQNALNRKLCLECGRPLSPEIGLRLNQSRPMFRCLNCDATYSYDDYMTNVSHLLDLMELEKRK